MSQTDRDGEVMLERYAEQHFDSLPNAELKENATQAHLLTRMLTSRWSSETSGYVAMTYVRPSTMISWAVSTPGDGQPVWDSD